MSTDIAGEKALEPEIFTREFPVEFSEDGDGRTLEARIVPYNTVATVADPPYYQPYQEMFVPGAFERQVKTANEDGRARNLEVLLNYEHSQALHDVVGHGVELASRDDALYGKFRIHDDAAGNKALLLVNEGILTGLSIEFSSKVSQMVDGVKQRVRAHLDKVALCRPGLSAYKKAEVVAVRMEVAPVELNPELNERLERIGFEPLLRRAVVRKPWDGSAARFEDDEWKRACLLDRGESFDTAKTRYALPVLEPNGDLNVNALGAAAGRLNQVQGGSKAAAARKLVRYYRQAGIEPPASVLSAASR